MKSMMPMMIVMMLIIIVAIFYVGQGISIHNQVPIEEAKFHALQESYFLESKTVRDAAGANSELNQTLVKIMNYPSSLLELKFVGVGKILTGIFIILFCVLLALMMMPKRLAGILRRIIRLKSPRQLARLVELIDGEIQQSY